MTKKFLPRHLNDFLEEEEYQISSSALNVYEDNNAVFVEAALLEICVDDEGEVTFSKLEESMSKKSQVVFAQY